MSKEEIISRHARNLKSLVGTGLAQDECNEIIKYAVIEALTLYGVGSGLFMLLDEDNEPVMPLVLDEQKAIETRLKYLKDGIRKAITINRVEVI